MISTSLQVTFAKLFVPVFSCELATCDVQRLARLEARDAVDRPAAEQPLHQRTATRQVSFSGSERQFVRPAHHQVVRDVDGLANRGSTCLDRPVQDEGRVFASREGVPDERLQALRKPFVELHLQGVVPGFAITGPLVDRRNVRDQAEERPPLVELPGPGSGTLMLRLTKIFFPRVPT